MGRTQFQGAVADLDSEVTRQNQDQIFAALMRLVAMVGDGHTHLAIPPNFHGFPLELYWFGNTLRVTRVSPAYRGLAGAKLTRIGDTDIRDAYKLVVGVIPQGENELWVRRMGPLYLVCAELLHGLGLLPTADTGKFTFEQDNGGAFEVRITPILWREWEADQAHWASPARSRPLYQLNRDKRLWFTYLKQEQTLFFKYDRAPGYREFYRVSRQLLEAVDTQQVKTLVIDLRNNGGGDLTKLKWLLLPDLVKRRYTKQCFPCPREIDHPRRLFIIIGRETYSAGMINAIELKEQAGAMLLGEPSGGRPNAYSEDTPIILPNSHLVAFVATRFYHLVQDETPFLAPEKPIAIAWGDFVSGRDPVLEWILSQK
jgi:hypothetical protein